MDASLSLQPILLLLAALARDLQADFLPLFAPSMAALVRLVKEGADRHPDIMEHVFTCISLTCKYLVKHLAADLPAVLAATAGLRYSRAAHVRAFAAEALGYLLRSASGTAGVRAGVRALLAEQAARPSAERTEGVGECLGFRG